MTFTGAAKIEKSGNLLLVCRRVIRHWRGIVTLLILACAVYIVIHSEFVFFDLIGLTLLLTFIASQIFWIRRIIDLLERLIPGRPRRARLARISQTKMEKGCRFWHNSFCPKEILPEEATALWSQSVPRKTSDFIP